MFFKTTLPCSTLCDVEIEEGLFPEDQVHAIHALQYGTSAKLIFPIQAGELTAKSGENGTMEGAVYSGKRAARIAERLAKDPTTTSKQG